MYRGPGVTHHKAEIAPLVEEVTIYVNAVGLRQIFGNYLADGLKIDVFLAAVILHVSKVITAITVHAARLNR
jgi:hypothetical protein